MKVTINSPLITEGFVIQSKAGLQLFVSLANKNMGLVCTKSSVGELTLSYEHLDHLSENKLHEITFTSETEDERYAFKGAQLFEYLGKMQHQFLLVKYEDLEELK